MDAASQPEEPRPAFVPPGEPAATSDETALRARARAAARAAAAAALIAALSGGVAVFVGLAILTEEARLVAVGRRAIPLLLGSAGFALFGGVALLLVAAQDLAFAANRDALAGARRATQWALAGAALLAAPLGSAVVVSLSYGWGRAARSDADFFIPALAFAGGTAWLGLTAVLGDRDLAEAARDPALRPTPQSLAERRATSNARALALGLLLALFVGVPCAFTALLTILGLRR